MPSKGTTWDRGYDHRHKKIRQQLKPLIASGKAICWRCGLPIRPDAKWDLGHDDHDRSKYRGPEHIGCNRATKGRNKPPPTGEADTTRDW